MTIVDLMNAEREAKRQSRLASNYAEDFLKAEGLWERFLEYAEAEDDKKPKNPLYLRTDD